MIRFIPNILVLCIMVIFVEGSTGTTSKDGIRQILKALRDTGLNFKSLNIPEHYNQFKRQRISEFPVMTVVSLMLSVY